MTPEPNAREMTGTLLPELGSSVYRILCAEKASPYQALCSLFDDRDNAQIVPHPSHETKAKA